MSTANSRHLLALVVVPLGTLGLLLSAHTALGTSTSFNLAIVAVAAVTWPGGAALCPRTAPAKYTDSLMTWGLRGWSWWLLPGAWWVLWTVAPLPEEHPWRSFLAGTSDLWLSVALAGWIATGWTMAIRRSGPDPVLNDGGRLPNSEPPFSRDSERSALPGRPQIAPAHGDVPHVRPGRTVTMLTLAIAVYVVVFTGMNWGLWFNLRLPHGDSAMYEEHLWNLEHGKGFRSYLDQGLFLGEHIQVIHVLLVPLHFFWPSQLLLELCESLALALGAVPVFLIARRHSGSPRAALLLAITYLLYFPVQFLDIAIDLKTFRPIAFGVPLLLWAIDRLERGRYLGMTILLALVLSAKEDYAIVICLLGLWLCGTSIVERLRKRDAAATQEDSSDSRRAIILGAALAVFAGVYLCSVVKFVIPSLRDGETVHYARYFDQFGDSPGEILVNMLTPTLLFHALVTVPSALLVLRLLLPLALLPLLSPGRLLVGVPLIVLLCLNTITQDFPAPVHHFHAPLLPILFWSAAAGLGRLARRPAGAASETTGASALRLNKSAEGNEPQGASPGSRAESETTAADTQNTAIARSLFAARLVCACAFSTGLFWSISPLGRQFWDTGGSFYWRTLYVPGERARSFEQIAALIPPTARVASTDFVHTRLTHCERSYDYSDYPRAVAGYEDRVPHDTDFIVIDVEHPYHEPQKIAALRNDPYGTVRELIREPDRWELLPETGNGYFLVLKRRDAGVPPE